MSSGVFPFVILRPVVLTQENGAALSAASNDSRNKCLIQPKQEEIINNVSFLP